MNQPMRSRSARGFTLVELLVVIGIIAVLIGILLPSLSRARDAARTTACLSNLRQIAMAYVNYTTDNKGATLPGFMYPIVLDGSGKPKADTTKSEYWANILTDNGYIPAPIVQNLNGKNNNGTGAPGPRTGRNPYFCPAGEPDLRDTAAGGNTLTVPASRVDGHGDFGYRLPNFDFDSVDVWYGCNSGAENQMAYDPSVGGPPLHRMTASGLMENWPTTTTIRHSAEMVLFYDGILDSLFNKVGSSNPNRLSARHNRKTATNLAFADGHAATFETKSLPGGNGLDASGKPIGATAMTAFYDPTYLQQNFPPPAPQWRLETIQY